ARARAVTGAQDVAQVGLVLESVGVLLGVADGAGAGRRLPVHRRRLFGAFLRDVLGSRPVAGLALHVLQLLGVAEAGAPDLAIAGDVAADALVVVLLAAVDEGLPGVCVHGLLPER